MPEIFVPNHDKEKVNRPSRKKDGPIISGTLPEVEFQQSGFHSGPSRKRKFYQIILWSWYASLVDTLVVASISCVFLLSYAISLKFNLIQMPINTSLQLILMPLFIIGYYSYQIATRYFVGQTLGEWACDLHVAFLSKTKVKYLFSLIFRETVLLVTGIFLIPIVSLIVHRDILGKISGLYIFSKK